MRAKRPPARGYLRRAARRLPVWIRVSALRPAAPRPWEGPHRGHRDRRIDGTHRALGSLFRSFEFACRRLSRREVRALDLHSIREVPPHAVPPAHGAPAPAARPPARRRSCPTGGARHPRARGRRGIAERGDDRASPSPLVGPPPCARDPVALSPARHGTALARFGARRRRSRRDGEVEDGLEGPIAGSQLGLWIEGLTRTAAAGALEWFAAVERAVGRRRVSVSRLRARADARRAALRPPAYRRSSGRRPTRCDSARSGARR